MSKTANWIAGLSFTIFFVLALCGLLIAAYYSPYFVCDAFLVFTGLFAILAAAAFGYIGGAVGADGTLGAGVSIRAAGGAAMFLIVGGALLWYQPKLCDADRFAAKLASVGLSLPELEQRSSDILNGAGDAALFAPEIVDVCSKNLACNMIDAKKMTDGISWALTGQSRLAAKLALLAAELH